MPTDKWSDGSANWNTPADWSAGVPTATSNVVVSEGDPEVTSAISIASLSDSATVAFADVGASSVSGAVDVSGSLLLDSAAAQGGSSLSIGGELTNRGEVILGNSALSTTDAVTAVALDNIGTLDLVGGATLDREMRLEVSSAAGFGSAGEVQGLVTLSGYSQIEFASGEITGIEDGAALTLIGPDAVIADAGAPSALSGLTDIGGALTLESGARLATGGGLTVEEFGAIEVSSGSGLTVGGAVSSFGDVDLSGPSRLTVQGILTNDSELSVGGGADLAAQSLVNIYLMPVQDGATVQGALTNNGDVIVSEGPVGGSALFDGAVTGQGLFSFGSGEAVGLKFGSSVSAGEVINFDGGGEELILGDAAAKDFGGQIDGFDLNTEHIDVKGFGSGTTMSFVENSADSAGVLTLTDGANAAHLAFNGSYSSSDFSLRTSATDSFVRFV
jgi:hypothetical protein